MNENKEKEQIVFSKYKKVLKITLTAIFAALSFAVLFLPKIYIPSPVGRPFIHFGNLIIILVALLFGGQIGAISGAIGMSVYDLIDGYGIWTIKTFILKFCIGIVTGLVYYHYNKKKNKNVVFQSYLLGSLFIVFGLILMTISIINNSIIIIMNKEVVISWPLYVFSIVLGLLLILVQLFTKKRNRDFKIAIYASTIGIIANIVGEFIGKFLKSMVEGQQLFPSIAQSIASLPATIINGVITIITVALIYPVLKKAVNEISLMK